MLREDFKHYRDELIISSKAGWDMWPGPYGQGGSRKYVLASLDQACSAWAWTRRYFLLAPASILTPRWKPPSALATAVQQGKALYIGISSPGSKPVKSRRCSKSGKYRC